MINLMYHDLTVDGDSSSGFQNTTAFQYKVDVEVFEETLQLLRGREDVTFTFDDGGVSFLTLAAPLLERYGRRGVFFISTKYVGTPGFLTREEVGKLERRAHIIGSHSHSHPENITLLSEEEQREEWEMSCRELEQMLGHPIELISIPNGYVTAASRRLFDTLKDVKRIYYTCGEVQNLLHAWALCRDCWHDGKRRGEDSGEQGPASKNVPPLSCAQHGEGYLRKQIR